MADKRIIGNFELIERIGQGGMGAVFKARQISMDRIVALKVLPPRLAAQPAFIERFMREAHASARLNHPNIVRGIDVGVDGGVYYFAMEYVEGASAKTLVRPGGIPEAQVLRIGKAMAEALDHAHSHGILHRDVKPDNILIDANDTPKLCDLGLARVDSQSDEEKSLTQVGTALGTPLYISPEQARGESDLDAKTDLYSLGATLYHLLTGKPMFDGATSAVVMTKHLTSKALNPQAAGVTVSKGLLAILAKLLVKERADRYESAKKLAEDCERVIKLGQPQHAMLAASKWPFAAGESTAPGRKTGGPAVWTPTDKVHVPHRRGSSPSALGKLGLAAVVMIALAILIVYVSGHAKSGEPTTATPAASAEHAPAVAPAASSVADEIGHQFDAAQAHWKKNPEQFDEAIAEFDQVRIAASGTAYESKAKDAIDDITTRREAALDAQANKFDDDAQKLAAAGKFDSAMAIWSACANQRPALSSRATRAEGLLQNRGEAAIQQAVSEATGCLGRKAWDDGLQVLAKADGIEYAAGKSAILDLRTQLQNGKKAELEAQSNALLAKAEMVFTQHVNAFVKATMKGDYAAAHKAAAVAEADPLLSVMVAKLGDLSNTCASLDAIDRARTKALAALMDGRDHALMVNARAVSGVVTGVSADSFTVSTRLQNGGFVDLPVKYDELGAKERARYAGKFKPQTPSDFVALAIHSLTEGDAASAREALSNAKDHALTPAYQAIVDEKLMGVVEAAAKAAYEIIVRSAGSGKIPEQKVKELTDQIKAFELEHGKTAFAATVADKLAEIRNRLSMNARFLTKDVRAGVKLELVLINPGTFLMGSPLTEDKRMDIETQHQVTLTKPYYLGKYAVTQEQYETVTGTNPSPVKNPLCPVTFVSWNDAQDFCEKLSDLIKMDARLPSEAEWEYACRAGTTTAYYFGDTDEKIGEYCIYAGNADDAPFGGRGRVIKMPGPVGQKPPNAWGLYDMNGNVMQWCQDWYDLLPKDPATDPKGPDAGEKRILRGGSCMLSSAECRSAFRIGYPPVRVSGHVGGFGFRVAFNVPEPKDPK